MEKYSFDFEQLKITKLVFTFPDLREMYQSLGIERFMSSDLTNILQKILSISYFKDSKIDLNYVLEKAESLDLQSIIISMLIQDLERIDVKHEDFWITVDTIKSNHVKGSIIPVLLSEYENLLKSDSEIEVLSPLHKINESISTVLGKTEIQTKTEAELKDIRQRIGIYTSEVEDKTQKRFFTGYHSLDSELHGFATSEFGVFMGASGSGKTTLLLNLAYQLWNNAKANILFFTLEMPTSQVLRRLDSRILDVEYENLKLGRLNKGNSDVIKSVEEHDNMFKVIDVPPKTSVRKIEEYILSSIIKPDVVIVDYIGLLGGHMKKRAEKWEILDEAAMSLKYLAKRYQICVITASQITSEAMKRKEARLEGYQLYDIAGAKAIADHSDLLVGIQYDDNLKMMSFSSPKYRDGAKFSFQMFVDLEKCRIYEIKEKSNE